MNACKRNSHDSPNAQAVDLSPEGRLIGWSEKPIITMTTMKNKVQLIGHVGNDPELKNVGSNGTAMLRLRLATNERFKAGAGEWKEDTQWHPVVVWGKQAERLAGQVRKGTGLMLEGRLVHSSYEAKDGSKRMSTEVVVSDYQLLAPRTEVVLTEAEQ
jgi:single-strand DNA-binding protein